MRHFRSCLIRSHSYNNSALSYACLCVMKDVNMDTLVQLIQLDQALYELKTRSTTRAEQRLNSSSSVAEQSQETSETQAKQEKKEQNNPFQST